MLRKEEKKEEKDSNRFERESHINKTEPISFVLIFIEAKKMCEG